MARQSPDGRLGCAVWHRKERDMLTPTLRRIATSAAYTLLWCEGLGVLVEDVLLLKQNRQLQAALHVPPQVAVGKQLRNLSALTLAGELEQIPLPSSDRKRLLIITFSPVCPACEDNRRGWLALAAKLKTRSDWRVMWTSRDSVGLTAERLSAEDKSSCEILADPPYRTYLQLGMAAVPKTIAVRADGSVDRAWEGRLQGEGWDEIAAYFGVSGLVSSGACGQGPMGPARISRWARQGVEGLEREDG
jgi:hypothetical protein